VVAFSSLNGCHGVPCALRVQHRIQRDGSARPKRYCTVQSCSPGGLVLWPCMVPSPLSPAGLLRSSARLTNCVRVKPYLQATLMQTLARTASKTGQSNTSLVPSATLPAFFIGRQLCRSSSRLIAYRRTKPSSSRLLPVHALEILRKRRFPALRGPSWRWQTR
jgi:hypothetical protein